MFRIAIAYRKVPETVVPTMLVVLCSSDPEFRTGLDSALTPSAIRNVSANTIVE